MKQIAFLLVWIIIMFAISGGAIYYVASRYALFFAAIPKKAWILGFVASFFSIFICVLLSINNAHIIGKIMFIFGGIAMSLLIFTLLSVALIDVFNLIYKFAPHIRGLLSTVLAISLTAYSVWNAHNLKVKEITIPIKGLTHEIRAVHITDIHLGNVWGQKKVDKITRNIKKLNPDVIFNTGDMFYSKVHFGEGKDILSAFRALEAPHYFVYGNHDVDVGIKEVIEQMQNANIKVLLNEIAYFGELQIIGLNDKAIDQNVPFNPHTKPGSETIKSVMARLPIDDDRPTIVLSHRPDGVKYMHEKGADLLLAGHTHAGQIFPFSLIAKLMFKYNSGLYQYKK